jgi:predicted nicotinamide N-methyase
LPGYQTKQEHVLIQGAARLVICSLLDRQQFADPHGEAAALGISSAAWPLFGLVWPSALQLAARMAVRPVVAGERILEVGCGLGLASLVSHRRGADVTASDCHPLASMFLGRNVLLNGLPPLAYHHGPWQGASAHDDVIPHAGNPGRYGLIIGSDVLYERDEPGHLPRFIDRHALPDAEVLIVDPDRGNRSHFNRRMAQAGFVLEQTHLSRLAPEDAAYRGRLLHFRRRAAG